MPIVPHYLPKEVPNIRRAPCPTYSSDRQLNIMTFSVRQCYRPFHWCPVDKIVSLRKNTHAPFAAPSMIHAAMLRLEEIGQVPPRSSRRDNLHGVTCRLSLFPRRIVGCRFYLGEEQNSIKGTRHFRNPLSALSKHTPLPPARGRRAVITQE